MSNKEEFESLAAFLALFGDEVQAHGREDLSEEEKKALRKLAAGDLNEEGRKALIPLLAQNEVAMEYLVEEADAAQGPE